MWFHRKMLSGFLAADILFFVIHSALGFATLKGLVQSWPDFFNIGRDWSGGEILNYIKWVLIVFALTAVYRKGRQPVFLGLAGFFFVCLLDDSLQIHERGAEWLIFNHDIYRFFGSGQAMAGELITWTMLGVPALASLGIGWGASTTEDRQQIFPALLLFAGVAFCAIGLDVLHTVLDDRSLEAGVLGILEDGGEMVFLTFLLAFVWQIFSQAEAGFAGNTVR